MTGFVGAGGPAADGAEALESLVGSEPLSAGEPATLPGRVWRRLGHNLRVGVVTGGASGIGFAVARRLARAGMRLALAGY